MAIRKILQIIPADGWYSVYAEDDGEELRCPLACWALVEEEGNDELRYATGIDATGDCTGIDFSDECSNFVRYEKGAHVPKETMP